MSDWLVYIIRCSDGSLYTGITTNMARRFAQHQQGKGAKYFSGRKPQEVVYLERFPDRAGATRREMQIKAMRRSQKMALLEAYSTARKDSPHWRQ